MTNRLKQYFPMLRTRTEIMEIIIKDETLKTLFDSWETEFQEEFLNICTGISGVKVLYDFMIKEILNPEAVPERIGELLSLLLNQKVKVLTVLPNDTTRIADETSLIITDIVVELEDGSIANIEIQKIGYQFPGERCACYSSDLLLRQYKRIKGNLHIKVSKTSTPLSSLKKVQKHFINFLKIIFIFLNKNLILDCRWNCYKNIFLFLLTSLKKISKIKISKAN